MLRQSWTRARRTLGLVCADRTRELGEHHPIGGAMARAPVLNIDIAGLVAADRTSLCWEVGKSAWRGLGDHISRFAPELVP